MVFVDTWYFVGVLVFLVGVIGVLLIVLSVLVCIFGILVGVIVVVDMHWDAVFVTVCIRYGVNGILCVIN